MSEEKEDNDKKEKEILSEEAEIEAKIDRKYAGFDKVSNILKPSVFRVIIFLILTAGSVWIQTLYVNCTDLVCNQSVGLFIVYVLLLPLWVLNNFIIPQIPVSIVQFEIAIIWILQIIYWWFVPWVIVKIKER